MIWSDKGFLLSKLAFQENSIIANFYTKNHGKCSGIIYGATSKKIKNWRKYLNKSLITERDSKTKLQEYSLKTYKLLPVYKLLDNKGPRHKPLIKVSVKIKNSKNITATGNSKKEAEQKAAKKLLTSLKLS